MSRDSTHQPSSIGPWLAVIAWYGIILLTIPFARSIQEGIVAYPLGQNIFYFSIIPLAGGLIVALTQALRRDRRHVKKRMVWFLALVAASVWVLTTQLQAPIEFIHFVEYSILSLLLSLAWKQTIRDDLVYFIAMTCVAIAAYVDELIQWMVPGRYWDFNDIRLNMIAGVIIQVFLSQVIVYERMDQRVARRSVHILCRLAWLVIFLFAFAFWNTPARVESYASRIPILQFLIHNESVMAEYGHRHRDPEIGTFYSRMTIEELVQIDRERGEEAGRIIAESMDTMEYMDFLQIHTASKDPYLHELRVHLYRRNHYYLAAWKHRENDPERYVHHMTVAFQENQLLENYFPTALAAAQQRFQEETLAEITGLADMDTPYVSPVSDHLITKSTLFEYELVFLVLAAGVGMIYVRNGREKKSGGRAPETRNV